MMQSRQQLICKKYHADFFEINPNLKIGVSANIKSKNIYPIHGLRHNPTSSTTGWYIWVGEYSLEDDFFLPLHAYHLEIWRPDIFQYLALPPGYRFLIGENGYEDIWFDEHLI